MDLILASRSPRRVEMLAKLGFKFNVVVSNVDEGTVKFGANPAKSIEEIASLKSNAVFKTLTDVAKLHTVVLGADTVVVCDGEILLKPSDADEARETLRKLSGRKHQVITGVALTSAKGTETFSTVTDVYFRDLSDETINNYIMSGEPMDKAGAYGIQDKGSLLVAKIDGDYFNVVGLPISKTAEKLENYGIKVI